MHARPIEPMNKSTEEYEGDHHVVDATNKVDVTILLFAKARELIGQSELKLRVNSTISAHILIQHLVQTFPKLSDLADCSLLSVNHEFVDRNALLALSARDEIAFIPPISGG